MVRLRVALALAAILFLTAWKPGDGDVITAGHDAYFAGNVDQRAGAACGWRLETTRIQPKEVLYRFTHAGGARATVMLGHPSTCEAAVKARFCVSASLSRGADPAGRCGVAFLRTLVRDGVGKNPGHFSWFKARVKKGRPYEKRQKPPGKPPTPHEVQFVLVSVLLILLLAAMGVTLVRTRPWRTLSRPEGVALIACLALAAASRLVLDPFPADVWPSTSQGLWLVGVHHWSAAYSALLHLLFALFPTSLDTAAAANVVLACATVLAVYVFVALYLDDRLVALAAAAALALQPISIRYAASDSPHVFYTLALFLAVLFTTLWARRGGYLWALQAAGWLAVCANTRVEAVVSAGAVVCVLIAVFNRGGAATLRQLAAGMLLGLAAMAYPLWVALNTVVTMPTIGTFSLLGAVTGPFINSPHSPLPVILLAALGGAVVLASRGLRRRGLSGLAAMVLVSTPSVYITDVGWEHTHRHSLPSLAMFVVLAGLGLGWLLGRGLDRVTGDAISAAARRWLRPALALALVALAALPNLEILTRTWTHELEFEFLRANLGRVEDGCTVVAIDQPDAHVGLNLNPVMSQEVGRQHRWMEPHEFLASTGPLPRCIVFIESASCHASHARAPSAKDGIFGPCGAIMDRYVLQPVAVTTVPALPYIGEVFTRDPVPLGIHRILGRRPRPRGQVGRPAR